VKHQLAGLRVNRLRIVVRDYDNIGADEDLCELRSPFARPSSVGGRGYAEAAQPVGILFALNNKNPLAELDLRDQFRQAVRDLANAFDGPIPFVARSGLALAEVFRIEAADLK
jgi:hypothetical protein